MLNALFLLYLWLLLLRPNEFVPWLRGVPILQSLLLACVALWVFRKDKHLELPQLRLVIWFVIAVVLSVGFAGYWGGTIDRLSVIIPVMLMFLLVTMVARELSVLRKIMITLIVCSCLMVFHGQQQLLVGVGWTGLPATQGRITYAGIFSDPNDLGQLFDISIACCLYLSRDACRPRKMLIALVIVWLCYGVYLTDSRGTMLAALAVFGVAGIRRYGIVRIGVLGAVAASLMIVKTRFGQISANEESAMDRIESWYAGMQMFRSHPLFGVGMNNYLDYHYLTAHNSIVLPAAELGMFGFIPWLGILWYTGKMLRWLVLTNHVLRDPDAATSGVILAEYEAAFALTNVATAFAVSSFFLSQSYKHVLFLVAGLVMARFVTASKLFQDAPSYSLGRELPRLVAVSVCTIVGMWVTTRMLL